MIEYYVVVYVAGLATWPFLVYIGFPLLKKWLMQKWKLEPKKDEQKNEQQSQ